jgi:hypothetical protein
MPKWRPNEPSIYDRTRSSRHAISWSEFRAREENNIFDMVIPPGDTTALDDPDMTLVFFRLTDFSTDAFETFFGHHDFTC